VKSHITASFRRSFDRLSKQMQNQARDAYRRFRADPNHPSLRFKKVHPTMPIFSARVGKGHRAIGILEGEVLDWISQRITSGAHKPPPKTG